MGCSRLLMFFSSLQNLLKVMFSPRASHYIPNISYDFLTPHFPMLSPELFNTLPSFPTIEFLHSLQATLPLLGVLRIPCRGIWSLCLFYFPLHSHSCSSHYRLQCRSRTILSAELWVLELVSHVSLNAISPRVGKCTGKFTQQLK